MCNTSSALAITAAVCDLSIVLAGCEEPRGVRCRRAQEIALLTAGEADLDVPAREREGRPQ